MGFLWRRSVGGWSGSSDNYRLVKAQPTSALTSGPSQIDVVDIAGSAYFPFTKDFAKPCFGYRRARAWRFLTDRQSAPATFDRIDWGDSPVRIRISRDARGDCASDEDVSSLRYADALPGEFEQRD